MIAKSYGIHLAFLFLVFSTWSYGQKNDLNHDFNLKLNWVSDANVNDNYTEYGDSYWSPSASYKLDYQALENWNNWFRVSSNYDNYYSHRSPVLSSPLFSIELGSQLKMDLGNKSQLRFKLKYGNGQVYDPEYLLVKRQQRIYSQIEYKIGEWNPGLEFYVDFENYGDNQQDGYTFWLRPDLQWAYKWGSKKDPLKLNTRSRYSIENRRSNGGLYTYIKQGVEQRVKLSWNRFSIYGQVAKLYKDYNYQFTNNQGDVVFKYNQYLSWTCGLDVELLDKLSFSTDWQTESIRSNQPGYSFSDGYLVLGLSYGLSF